MSNQLTWDEQNLEQQCTAFVTQNIRPYIKAICEVRGPGTDFTGEPVMSEILQRMGWTPPGTSFQLYIYIKAWSEMNPITHEIMERGPHMTQIPVTCDSDFMIDQITKSAILDFIRLKMLA